MGKRDENFPHETIRSITVHNNVAFHPIKHNGNISITSNIHSSNYGFESLSYSHIVNGCERKRLIKWNIYQNITQSIDQKKGQLTI